MSLKTSLNLCQLSNHELLQNTKNLVHRERQLFSEILHHLQEIQRRRLYCDLGYRSLWDYCMKGLGYSESQVKRVTDAMKLVQEIPEIEAVIERGELSLSNVVAAQVHFRAETRAGVVLSSDKKLEVLEGLKNKSTREGEKVLLGLATVKPPEVKESIRQVTVQTAEVKFGADEKLLEMMETVKGLLAHKSPNLGMSELMEVVFSMALEQLDPSRKISAKTQKKEVLKNSPPTAVGRSRADEFNGSKRKYISVKTKRQIWQKSGGKCTNCQSTYALELDHIQPISQGGNSSKENLRLLCRACNQRAAIKKIGQTTMDRYLT